MLVLKRNCLLVVVLFFGVSSFSAALWSQGADPGASGAAGGIKGKTADFQWEFSIRDASGKFLRRAKMKAEGTAALRDKERGACMYKFLRKENDAGGQLLYAVEESCAVAEEQARGNATVSNTRVYTCNAAPEAFDQQGVQSCASSVDTRTGKQFHCECKRSGTTGFGSSSVSGGKL